MFNINVAGAVVHHNTFKKLLLLKKQNIQFTVYDGPNLCPWNGGRINRDIVLTPEILEFYNRNGIKVALTFTNHEIDLTNKIGLELLKLLDVSSKKYKIKNKIILINEALRRFLRTNYDFELVYSITGHQSSIILNDEMISYYKTLEKKYDYIVPKYEFVFKKEFYENIDIKKYELLINDTCVYGCPHWHQHFIEDSRVNREYSNPWKELGKEGCEKIENCWLTNFNPDVGSEKDKEKYGEMLGMDYTYDMIKKAISIGYTSFKISGRENTSEQLENDLKRYVHDITKR